jgi:phage gp37-like protein
VSSVIAAVEEQLVARLRAAFQGRLREIDHKPARLDAEELSRILTQAPGAYVSFLGWRTEARLPERTVLAAWGVYLLAANAGGEAARRRGGPVDIGAYEMLAVATQALEGFEPAAAAGEASVGACESLFSAAFERAGRSCYGLVLDVPVEILAPDPAALGALVGEFRIFDAAWDVPPLGNVPAPPNPDAVPAVPAPGRDAHDRVNLPQ